jgi:excisionase family DNA binding protein
MRLATSNRSATNADERTMKPRKTRKTKTKVSPPPAARKRPAPATANGNPEALLTLTEAAFRLGRVHRTTIMRWVKEGRLRCVRLSRKAILFELSEIDRFVREHRYTGH